MQLLDDSMGNSRSLRPQPPAARGRPVRRLPPPRQVDRRSCFRRIQLAWNCGLCICRAQCRAGDSSNDPVDKRTAIQSPDVAWCRARLHRCCHVLFPGCDYRLLGLRQQRYRQHSYVRGKANMGHRHGQFNGCHSCHRELPSKLPFSLSLSPIGFDLLQLPFLGLQQSSSILVAVWV